MSCPLKRAPPAAERGGRGASRRRHGQHSRGGRPDPRLLPSPARCSEHLASRCPRDNARGWVIPGRCAVSPLLALVAGHGVLDVLGGIRDLLSGRADLLPRLALGLLRLPLGPLFFAVGHVAPGLAGLAGDLFALAAKLLSLWIRHIYSFSAIEAYPVSAHEPCHCSGRPSPTPTAGTRYHPGEQSTGRRSMEAQRNGAEALVDALLALASSACSRTLGPIIRRWWRSLPVGRRSDSQRRPWCWRSTRTWRSARPTARRSSPGSRRWCSST